MSKTTKRKHVTKEVVDDYYIPEGNESIVKVVCSRGNNLHEVVSADKGHFLVTMPTKFRKTVWIKRGDYVVIEPIQEGNKVQAEIVYVLYQKQIKYIKQEGLWPDEFFSEDHMQHKTASSKPIETSTPTEANSDSDSDFSDNELFKNPNHQHYYLPHNDTDDSDEDDSDSSDDDDEEEDALNVAYDEDDSIDGQAIADSQLGGVVMSGNKISVRSNNNMEDAMSMLQM